MHRRRQVQSCQRGGELHPPPHFRAGHRGRHRRPPLYEPPVPVQKIQRRNGRVDFRLYPKRKTSRRLPPAGAHEKTACRHRLLSRLLLPKPLYPRLQKVSLPHSAGIPPQARLRLMRASILIRIKKTGDVARFSYCFTSFLYAFVVENTPFAAV